LVAAMSCYPQSTCRPAVTLTKPPASLSQPPPPWSHCVRRTYVTGHRRWFDEQGGSMAGSPGKGRPLARPYGGTSVSDDARVLVAAHLDSDPTNNRLKNLRALCQRCHMLHDRPHHLAQRWITYRRRSAVGPVTLCAHSGDAKA
jgi:hypothetical protein